MKLSAGEGKLEVFGDTTEHIVGIGNPWLLIEYLTNMVYSDKQGIVVQEISSNSRDAHRETKQTRKIQIKLPSRLDSTISFRDFGPGIDQKRLDTVYLMYGNSTKRNDNTQTGGLGLGAKTPWSLVDVFQVRTITKEKNKLICREYSMVKGEDRTLKCIEMGQGVIIDPCDPNVPDDDKMTGTTVTINVSHHDIETIKQKIVKTCKWWKEEEKPEILNGSLHFPELKARLCEGSDWILLTEKESNNSGYEATQPTVVIDGIPYPLSAQALGISCGHDLAPLMDPRLVVFFNTGDLSLAISREALQYDQPTKDRLFKKLADVYDNLKEQVSNQLKNCTTFWDAVVCYQELQKSFKINEFVKKVKWNGISLEKQSFNLDTLATVRNYERSEESEDFGRITGAKVYGIEIKKSTLWVVNDEEQMSILKLHTLFNTNPDVRTITVITPAVAHIAAYEKFLTDHNIGRDNVNYTLLSTVEKYKRLKKVVDGVDVYKPKPVVKAFVYNGNNPHPAHKMWDAHDVDVDECEGVYVIIERYKATSCKHEMIQDVMNSLGNSVKLIGIPERFAKNIGDLMIPLNDFVRTKMEEIQTILDFDDIAQNEADSDWTMKTIYHQHTVEAMHHYNFDTLISCASSPFLAWYKRTQAVLNGTDKNLPLAKYRKYCEFLGETSKMPKARNELKAIAEECLERYPLLMKYFNSYEYYDKRTFSQMKDEFAFYINTKDSLLTSRKKSV